MPQTLERPMSQEFSEQPLTTMDVQVVETGPESEGAHSVRAAAHAVWRFMTGPHDASGYPSEYRAVPEPVEVPVVSDKWYLG
jgi:hypothetical protein